MARSLTLPAGYHTRAHRHLGDLAEGIYGLAALAFGQYPGVLRPSRAHRQWYVCRPGMDRDLSRAALYGEQLVGSVFVTRTMMWLGGTLRQVGILDTVMTHPDHRRRGLARRLLGEALEGLRECGADAALLYTVPGSPAWGMYRGLGFEDRAPVCYLQGQASSGESPAKRVSPKGDAVLAAWMDARLGGTDGYVPLDGALWAWRKRQRPPELFAEVVALWEGHDIVGTVTLCRAPIIAADGTAEVAWVLADLTLSREAEAGPALGSLLAGLSQGEKVIALCAESEAALLEALIGMGLSERGREVAMVLPFGEGIGPPHNGWYVLNESVVGV